MPDLRAAADGVHLGAVAPGSLLNVVVIEAPDGVVVLDAGMPWSGGRIARLLRGRDVVEHVVSHAHADHTGATAWLCETTGAPLAMGAADAGRFADGSVVTHRSPLAKLVAKALDPRRRPVDRALREGDDVAGFAVLEVPGHSRGLIALWRESDRVLVVGHGPVNVSRDGASPRFVHMPKGLDEDPAGQRAAETRLGRLRPAVVVSAHGHPVRDADAWARACGVHRL
jgi:hydroxyacylglutathione hydrolase